MNVVGKLIKQIKGRTRMAVYLTGDTHREFHRIKQFCEEYDTTVEDILIILGDAGINYYCDHRDNNLKNELSQLPITLF